eukprot:1146966-Pelagomonas_calceolata.AAC.4
MQYIMAYLETVGAVRKGERVLQVGMGGGMKVSRALDSFYIEHNGVAANIMLGDRRTLQELATMIFVLCGVPLVVVCATQVNQCMDLHE